MMGATFSENEMVAHSSAGVGKAFLFSQEQKDVSKEKSNHEIFFIHRLQSFVAFESRYLLLS